MKIAVIGTGYVGLSTGVGFASKGNEVICVDIDKKKVEQVNKGVSPIYEPLLSEHLKKVLKEKKLRATDNLHEAIGKSEIVFVSVGTPSKEDGSIDLKYIENVSKDIGRSLTNKGYKLIVVKSTVVPETTGKVVIPLLERYSGKKAGRDFGVCMNPEFLREGKAMEDFLNPDRIVIGGIDKKSGNILERLYENFDSKILRTDLKTAEMIKYASNAFLAIKISFSNEIGNVCKRLGIDVYDVMKGVGLDKRISPHFLRAGAGYGGSCFPKDVDALVRKAKDLKYEPRLLEEVQDLNRRQKVGMVDLLERKIGDLKGKEICVLGLAFKPDTDDIRGASSVEILSKLTEKGAKVRAYDPKAEGNTRRIFPDVDYTENVKDAIKGSDACLIVTEWEEFRKLEDKDFKKMRSKIIIEGRKILDPTKVTGFEGICW
ncbi:MAG: nucleotide sugar dehydrogenase [Candidatus Aenigmarchaeota archaeon]|nr:nucleotide sugar dehydrogenase [Candidatus Aenigmarchaeota archaeon]